MIWGARAPRALAMAPRHRELSLLYSLILPLRTADPTNRLDVLAPRGVEAFRSVRELTFCAEPTPSSQRRTGLQAFRIWAPKMFSQEAL